MSALHTICIIDDDEIYQLFTKKAISRFGKPFTILSYVNGREAILDFTRKLQESESLPDLILLDINMPVMDGWQFMEAFESMKAQVPKNIQIYIVSSSIAPGDIDRATNNPSISGFVSKPLDVATLEKLLMN